MTFYCPVMTLYIYDFNAITYTEDVANNKVLTIWKHSPIAGHSLHYLKVWYSKKS